MTYAYRPSQIDITQNQIMAAAQLWRDGKDTRQIAQELRTSEAAVANRIERIRAVAKLLNFDSSTGRQP